MEWTTGVLGMEHVQDSLKSSLKVYGILLFCVICYASTFIFGALLIEAFTPIELTFLRLLFINLFLLSIGYKYLKAKEMTFKLLIILAISAFIGITLSHFSLYVGLTKTDPITAALIYGLGPLITSLITYIFLKEYRRIYFWVGLASGLFGVLLVVSEGHNVSLKIGDGEILIGITILSYSTYLVIVQYLTKYLKPMTVTVYTSLFALIFCLPFLDYQVIQSTVQISGFYWFVLISTAILTNGLCTMLWNDAIKQVGASISSLFLNVEPFAAMVLGFIILGQVVLPIQLIGAVFIIVGVILGTRFGKRKVLEARLLE